MTLSIDKEAHIRMLWERFHLWCKWFDHTMPDSRFKGYHCGFHGCNCDYRQCPIFEKNEEVSSD